MIAKVVMNILIIVIKETSRIVIDIIKQKCKKEVYWVKRIVTLSDSRRDKIKFIYDNNSYTLLSNQTIVK